MKMNNFSIRRVVEDVKMWEGWGVLMRKRDCVERCKIREINFQFSGNFMPDIQTDRFVN